MTVEEYERVRKMSREEQETLRQKLVEKLQRQVNETLQADSEGRSLKISASPEAIADHEILLLLVEFLNCTPIHPSPEEND